MTLLWSVPVYQLLNQTCRYFSLYRKQLKQLIPPLLEKWLPVLGIESVDWGIKRWKPSGAPATSMRAASGWILNWQKAGSMLEYIVVHELMHLLERHHNDRFMALMDQHLSNWRVYRDELNQRRWTWELELLAELCTVTKRLDWNLIIFGRLAG